MAVPKKSRSHIEPMKNIARSLCQHRELILNYFRAQKLLSGGVVEGLNKAKVTVRESYGFRTFRCCPRRNRGTNSSDEPQKEKTGAPEGTPVPVLTVLLLR